ncbi:MAG: ABC transporter ATP-binding protein [Thermodesulfobacteriota bacterium]|nr:ABC transporter ATP-binding protein [Thermodesulfobacteriota bacterium]
MEPQINSENRFLLNIKNLKTYFFIPEGTVKAVDDVSFHVKEAEIVGLVGESGCGKSVTALSILGLIPWSPGRIIGGQIIFQGEDLRKIGPQKLREIRGNKISMIFQEPMTSLNPVYTIGRQIAEVYMEHQGSPKKEALERAIEMLDKLGIPSPSKRVHEYPHNLSGGMRQRVMTAMALACNPELILADEPTTALDVTIQAQILELIAELQQTLSTSILLITHNLSIIAEYAQRVIVMYSGKIVEEAPVVPMFEEPLHPYTIGLLGSIPKLGAKAMGGKQRLSEIPGMVPSVNDLPQGCYFHPRCARARAICRREEPELIEIAPGRRIACWAAADGWE